MHTTLRTTRLHARRLVLALPLLWPGASIVFAQDTSQSEEPVYLLDPFSVQAENDGSYTASNSISGTRANTPIREIPLNIQVLTEAFADDLLLTSQVDLERYNASLVNGGDDVHSSNVIQQSYNGFLFRGFVQNWSLRDGVRQYDPVDAQGLSRIEIVKGPAAAMYGVTYPGGVMNAITKDVLFGTGADFADVSFTLGDYGEYRGTIDVNATTEVEYGKVGMRYNGAYQHTSDHREHSNGKIEFSQINLAYSPTDSTMIALLAENGYREQPSHLGYYTTAEVGADGVGLNNGADIPLQVTHPNIGWDWNWATDNMRSLDTEFYRAELTQLIGQNLSLHLYTQYSSRIQIDSDGLDASGSSGPASWDMGSSRGTTPTGWLYPNTPDEQIVMHYHYRDWRNKNRAYGGEAVYKLDVADIQNTFTAGAAFWREGHLSKKGSQPGNSPYVWTFAVEPRFNVTPPLADPDDPDGGRLPDFPVGPPPDYFWDVEAAFPRENNQIEYYFASWQAGFLNNRLRTNVAVNYTELSLKQKVNGLAVEPTNITEDNETSPLFGAMFDVTKNVSLFAVSSSSIFPTTDKNDFEEQLPPVTGDSIEGGVKLDLMDGKISGTLSYYVITQEGGSQRDPNANNLNKREWDSLTPEERAIRFPGITDRDQLLDRNGQPGDLVPGLEQESKGFEADLMIQPIKNWQVMLSYAHNTVEVTKSTDPSLEGRIPNSGHIKDQLSFVTRYTFDKGRLDGMFVGVGGQWAAGAFQNYFDDSDRDIHLTRYNPDTFYLEAFAGYNFKLFGVDSFLQLNVKNLTEVDEFVGWRGTGQSDVIATERYKVPTKMRFSLTYRARF